MQHDNWTIKCPWLLRPPVQCVCNITTHLPCIGEMGGKLTEKPQRVWPVVHSVDSCFFQRWIGLHEACQLACGLQLWLNDDAVQCDSPSGSALCQFVSANSEHLVQAVIAFLEIRIGGLIKLMLYRRLWGSQLHLDAHRLLFDDQGWLNMDGLGLCTLGVVDTCVKLL